MEHERFVKIVGIESPHCNFDLAGCRKQISIYRMKNRTWQNELYVIGIPIFDREIPENKDEWHVPRFSRNPNGMHVCTYSVTNELTPEEFECLRTRLSGIIRIIEDDTEENCEIRVWQGVMTPHNIELV